MSDPILEKRERIRRQSGLAQRVGYALFGAATILFFIGIFTNFSDALVQAIIGLLITGSVILAIAIQVGYAIRGAERHEEDSIAQRRRR
ncbi:MAG: hypothetical protein HKN94_08660 [Acidimicrobiales bacterium]|nr:hypothetical protein [Acidimicrobiia bacterium]NNC80208.1 hypothetical protein [Acidimicrobiales bacterium]RZV45523.1 MAG: hypothetical protein EX269_09685 [Acidimicrobiales bacterium]